MNTVQSLKVRPFSQLSLEEKKTVKRLGPDRPELKHLQQTKRKFSSDWYSKYEWLTGCPVTLKVYCFPCLLFGHSQRQESFTKSGMDDWGHMTQKCDKHAACRQHGNNVINLEMFGRTNVIEELSEAARIGRSQHNMDVDKNRHVLSRIIDCIKFCETFELALRGRDETEGSENPGIFLGLVRMTAEMDSILKSHLESASVFKGISKDIQNELLSIMFDICQEKIRSEIEKADYLAVISDDTTGVSQYSQNVVVLRYLVQGTVVERFWSFDELDGGNADVISTRVLNCLKDVLPLPGDSNKLIAQCYDGASVMSGERGGVNVKVKEVYENAHFVHCYAHQLNLIVQHSVCAEKRMKVFFASLNGFANFIHQSPQRTKYLHAAASARIPSPSRTRTWNFAGRIVKTVYENRQALMSCFDSIIETWKGDHDTITQALGLKRWLEDAEFIQNLRFFNRILAHVSLLFNTLQSRKLDPTAVSTAVANFTQQIDNERGAIRRLLADDEDDEPLAKRRKADTTDETVRAFCAVCDAVKVDCLARFSFTDHLIAATLLESSNFPEYNKKFPKTALAATVKAYPFLYSKKLKSELVIVLLARIPTMCRCPFFAPADARGRHAMYETPIFGMCGAHESVGHNANDILRSREMLFHNEENKNFSQKTERLNALAMLSMEKKLVSDSDFNLLVIERFVNKKERRAKFLYK